MSLQTVSETKERLIGRVKWFNNKSGYGFVTVTDGVLSGIDLFIHHSNIKVTNNEQYKYLIQGEYIEFTVDKIEGGKHEFLASQVTGIKGGKLMCETRKEIKESVNTYKMSNKVKSNDNEPVEKNSEWSQVKSKTTKPRQKQRKVD